MAPPGRGWHAMGTSGTIAIVELLDPWDDVKRVVLRQVVDRIRVIPSVGCADLRRDAELLQHGRNAAADATAGATCAPTGRNTSSIRTLSSCAAIACELKIEIFLRFSNRPAVGFTRSHAQDCAHKTGMPACRAAPRRAARRTGFRLVEAAASSARFGRKA